MNDDLAKGIIFLVIASAMLTGAVCFFAVTLKIDSLPFVVYTVLLVGVSFVAGHLLTKGSNE